MSHQRQVTQHQVHNVRSQITKPDPAKICVDLVKLMVDQNTSSQDVVNYMKIFHVSPDLYLPSFDGNQQLPLIYYCCRNPKFDDLFSYLLGLKVNLLAQIKCDNPDWVIELLYYSQTKYIPALIKGGCTLDPDKITRSGQKLLVRGNINKLMVLYKYKAITKEQLLQIIREPGVIFRVLDFLYERLYRVCRSVRNQVKQKELVDETVRNYVKIFKLFFKNGVNVNQIEDGDSLLQRILNTYLVDIIQLTLDYEPNFDRVKFLHFSNFPLSNRQVMNVIYNHENYKLIEELLKDKVVTRKIVKKLPVIRRTKN
jgi:hypothetical protein